MRLAVEQNRFPQHRRFAVERRVPQRVADDDDTGGRWPIFRGRESAAEHRVNAHRREEARRDTRGLERTRLTMIVPARRSLRDTGNVRKGVLSVANQQVVRIRVVENDGSSARKIAYRRYEEEPV